MSKREEFELTLELCQRLTETCLAARSNFPKKWGEKEVPINDQLIGREDLSALFKVLRAYSGWLQGLGDDYEVVFGDKDDWYPVDKTGKKLDGVPQGDDRIASWKWKEGQKKYKLRMDRDALSGAVWCCILRLHPFPIIPTSTKEAVDIWWKIADALGKTTAIKKYIGLAAANRTEWEDDPEQEAKS